MGIIEKSSSGGDYIVTEFGEEIFGKGDLDRFLEDQNTLGYCIGISVQRKIPYMPGII